MQTVKTWQLLIRMKERRIAAQQQAVAEAHESLQQCQAALDKARAAEAQRERQFEAAREALFTLLHGAGTFKPDLALMRKRQIDSAEQELKQAQHETTVHEQRVATVAEELRDAQWQLQRLQQQLQQYHERLAEVRRQLDQAQEDAQDEDAEETAVSRLLAASRELQAQAR